MKQIFFRAVCLFIIGFACLSCSDDSDKIDDYFAEKVERIKTLQPPVIDKVYVDGVTFVDDVSNMFSGKNDYWLFYTEDEPDDSYSIYSFTDLFELAHQKVCAPSTTYYYSIYVASRTEFGGGHRYTHGIVGTFRTLDLEVSEPLAIEPNRIKIRCTPKVSSATDYTLECSEYQSFRDISSRYHIDKNEDVVWVYSSNLKPNTTYYYRLKVHLDVGKDVYSEVKSFKTLNE